jgi:hypothetical protein
LDLRDVPIDLVVDPVAIGVDRIRRRDLRLDGRLGWWCPD